MRKNIILGGLGLIALYCLWSFIEAPTVDLGPDPTPPDDELVVATTETEAAGSHDAAARKSQTTAPAVAPRPASLRIRVTGTRSSTVATTEGTFPLPGVHVDIWREASGAIDVESRHGRRTTDAAGEARFDEVVAGRFRLRAWIGRQQIAAQRLVLEPGVDHVEEVRASCAGIVRGRVVDARRQPVPDAELRIGICVDDMSPEFLVRRVTQSAADGSFEFGYLATEQYVAAHKEGYGSSPSHPLQQLGTGRIELMLGDAFATVTGSVVDELGVAIPEVTIALQHGSSNVQRDEDGAWIGPRLPVLVETNEQGRFEARGLAPGSWTCLAWRLPWQRVSKRFVLSPGQQAEERLVMKRRATVFGFVRDKAGKELTGVHVSLQQGRSWQTANPRDDGAFRFEGVRYAPFKLLATRIASGSRTDALSFPAPTTRELRIDIEMDEGPVLRGRATTASGKALAGFTVTAALVEAERADSSVQRQRTGERGEFNFWNLERRRYRLRLFAPEATSMSREAQPLAEAVGVPGDPSIVLELAAGTRALGRVHGHCVDDAGRAVAAAKVTLRNFSAEKSWSTETDEGGKFEIDDLPREQLRFDVHKTDHVLHVQQLDLRKSNDLGLRVELKRAATLRVRFLREDGRPWTGRPPIPWLSSSPGVVLTAGRIDYQIEGTEVVVRGIPHGSYSVSGPHGDALLIRPVKIDLAMGDVRRLTMRVRVGRRCDLVFLGPASGKTLRVRVRSVGSADPESKIDFDIEARGDDGTRSYRKRTTLPQGDIIIEAKSDAGERFRLETRVPATADGTPRIEVPRTER